jgi:hypothetical protein
MRPKAVSAAVLAFAGLVLVSAVPAAADGTSEAKARYAHRYPRHAYAFKVDPYAWNYSPRGYYPYYNSGYWGSASYIKWRNREHLNVWNTQPPYFRYYKAWGYPRRHWDNREWHAEHHGFHHRWHW